MEQKWVDVKVVEKVDLLVARMDKMSVGALVLAMDATMAEGMDA